MMDSFTTARRNVPARKDREVADTGGQDGVNGVTALSDGGEPLPAFLTSDDIARLLGCSRRTVRRLADTGRIPPPLRLGGLSRWTRATVEEWIAAGCPRCRRPTRR
jgi:excisionase family DNA binding protein